MNFTKSAVQRSRARLGSAAGQIKLRHALVVAAGALVLALGLNATSGHAAVDSFSWTGASSANWSDAGNWTCTGTCSGGTPITDPNSNVVLPAGQPLATTLDLSATLNSLTVQGNYSIAGTGTTLTSASLSAPSSTLTLAGAAPSGVILVAPVAADSVNANSVLGVVVGAGNSFQTTTPAACGPTNVTFCLQTLSLAGTGPTSASNPGALVASGTLNIGSLTVAVSTTIQTNGHTVDFGSLTNDPAATLTTKGSGALEFGIAFDLHNLDFNIAANGSLNYVGTMNTATLAAGVSIGNKHLDSNIAARGTLTLGGDALIQLVDFTLVNTLTLNGSPQLADNGHTLTVFGSQGGALIMDGANQTTGAIAVQSGATLHASGTLNDVHVAGTGDAKGSPAAALHLDGSLAMNALDLDGNATVDVPAADTLTSAHAHAASAATLTLLHEGPTILGAGDTSNYNVTQTLGGVVTASGQLGTVTLNNGSNLAAFITVPDAATLHVANLALDSAGNVDGNGSVLVVDGNLTDNGSAQILTVNGHGSGVTLQGDTFNNTTDTVFVAAGSFLESGGGRLHDVHITDAGGSTCPVNGAGCSLIVTGNLTIDQLGLGGDAGIDVAPSKTLTVTSLPDAAFPMQLTLWNTGTTTVTNSVSLSNLKVDVAQSGTLGAKGTLNNVKLSSGSTLAATTGDLTVSAVLAEGAAVPPPAITTVTLAGSGRTITLSSGINGGQVTELLSGVTVQADGLSGNAMKVDAGATLKTSGSLSTLQIAGNGPSGTGNALLLDGDLTVTDLSLTGSADANVGAHTLMATNLLNPLSPATLTLHGSGLFTVTNSATRDNLSLAMPDPPTAGLKFEAQGSVNDVSVCLTCTSPSSATLVTLGAPAGTTLAIDGTLTLGNVFITIAGPGDIAGSGGTVSVTGPGKFTPNASYILVNGRLALNQVTVPNLSQLIQVRQGAVLTATGSLNYLYVQGTGGGPGALVVPAGTHDLTIAIFDAVFTNVTVNVASGRTLTLTRVFQAVAGGLQTVTLTGAGGTTVLTDPQLPPGGGLQRPDLFEVGSGATLESTCASGTCHMDDTTLDDGATLSNAGPSPVEVSKVIVVDGAVATITGNGTRVIVDSLPDSSAQLLIGTGSEPGGNGVTVVADSLSLSGLEVVVDNGSALLTTGSIGTLKLLGAGPLGGSGAAVVDSTPGPGALTVTTALVIDSPSTVLVDPGRTFTLSGNLTAFGNMLTFNGPGAFNGTSTVNLPAGASLDGGFEVGGGVVVNGGPISTPLLIQHGSSRVQPSELDFTGAAPQVLAVGSVTEGPAQLGNGSGSTSVVVPGGSTLHLTIGAIGAWIIVPAVISESGSPANLAVDGTLGTAQLNSNNTYTGGTTVATNTTLVVDGSQPQSDVTLLGGTLAGHGSVGAITGGGGGAVAPDNGATLTATNPVNLTGSNDTLQVTVGSGTGSALNATAGAAVANPPSGVPSSQGSLQVLTAGTAAPNATFDVLRSPTATGAFSGLPDGAELVTADNQRFRINYNGGTGHDVTLTALGPDPTTVAVIADNNPQTAGQPVQFTATMSSVDPSFTAPITGLVTFFDGATQIGQGAVGGNVASMLTSTLSGGVHHITAQYAGDSTHQGSTSPVYDETINLVSTITAIDTSPLALNGHRTVPNGTPLTLTATIVPNTATGTVTFLDGVQMVGSGPITSGTAQVTTSILSIGSHDLTAVYNGDGVNAGSSSPTLIQLISAPTTTTISVPQTTVPEGTAVTITAHVASATPGTITGTITCPDASTPSLDPGGTATCTTAPLSAGTHVFTIAYSGDDSYTTSTSPNLKVYTLAQSVTVSTDAVPSTDGNPMDFVSPSNTPITFSALVFGPSTTPTGTATFFDGGTSIGTGPLAPKSGTTALATLTTTLSQGLHVITVQYPGDANNGAGTSNAINQFVTAPTVSSFTVNTDPIASTDVGSLVFIAHVGTGSATPAPVPAGTVSFIDTGNSNVLGSAPLLPDGTAHLTGVSNLVIGARSIIATYSGDNTYGPSNSPLVVEHVTAPTATTVLSTGTPALLGDPVTFTATVTCTLPDCPPNPAAEPGGTLTFMDGGSSIGTGTLNTDCGDADTGCATWTLTTAALAAGVHHVTAIYDGDTAYTTSTSPQFSQDVLAPSTVTLSGSPNPALIGSPVTLTATISGAAAQTAGGLVLFRDGTTWLGGGPIAFTGGVAHLVTTFSTAGPHSLNVEYGGDSSYCGTILDIPPCPIGSGDSAPVNETVLIPTTTSLGTSRSPENLHHLVTFTATVASTSGTPTGSVTFLDGATTLASVAVGGGHATLALSSLGSGNHAITAVFTGTGLFGPSSGGLTQVIVPPGLGYWLVASDGGIFPFGNAGGYGSTGGTRLNQPIVGMASTPTGHGYWLVASDGGIFPFGDAQGFGSTGGIHLNQPIVGMAATPSGNGYWLVAADGGIFPFGDAGGFGSTGGIRLNQPIVGMAATPDGGGYWLVASDGGIFPFGDAGGFGSTGGIHLNQPVVGMASTATGHGYWLVASDGGIFPFGDAGGFGSTGSVRLNRPIVGMAQTTDGLGYWLVASDGGIFPFGDAPGMGSTGGIHLNSPIVGMAVAPMGYPSLPF